MAFYPFFYSPAIENLCFPSDLALLILQSLYRLPLIGDGAKIIIPHHVPDKYLR